MELPDNNDAPHCIPPPYFLENTVCYVLCLERCGSQSFANMSHGSQTLHQYVARPIPLPHKPLGLWDMGTSLPLYRSIFLLHDTLHNIVSWSNHFPTFQGTGVREKSKVNRPSLAMGKGPLVTEGTRSLLGSKFARTWTALNVYLW